MNRLLQLAALGVAFLPSAAFAQAAPPDGPVGRPQFTDAQKSQMHAAMLQSRQQMEQLHLKERTQILGSLSAAHRTALANIVGNLAVSPSPDYAGAERQLDALLTSSERNAIVSTHLQARATEKQLRDNERQAFLATLTADQRSAMDAARTKFESEHPNAGQRRDSQTQRTPDAGKLLLMLSGGHHEMGGPGGPGRDGMNHMGGPRGGF